MLRDLERTEHRVANSQNSPCEMRDGKPPDEMPIKTAETGGYFPFRGIVIASVLGAGVWLLVWLLA